ncbi:MAG: recombination protein RecR [Candidatus Levybacteria bacterium]|nr:recombination protein RecR [Candidatus Levybacteria bacterium]
MKIPQTIQSLIESFEKLPGIGPKTAQRLTFYLLHVPQHELDRFSEAVKNLKIGTTLCSVCLNVDETDPCSICGDSQRDHSIVCVVEQPLDVLAEQPLDVLALEKNGKYKGIYHVLHGKIDPLNNIGPDEIYVNQLVQRVKGNVISSEARDPQGISPHDVRRNDNTIREIILATNPTMEGEATAMYIAKQLKMQPFDSAQGESEKLKITRIGRGLPIGADLEYADPTTLERAMEGRSEY